MGLRGRGVAGAVLALLPLTTSFVMLLPDAPSAHATTGTTQNNGCLGVTGTFSQFAVPITGTATPNPDTGSTAITLGGTSVGISVDSTLIGAGVVTGLVSAADNLADIGVTKNDGTASATAGVDAVTAAAGSVKLKLAGSNTTEGTQTATNSAPANTTFYVTADALGGNVHVYTALSTPPAAAPSPGRTGTLLVGSLTVSIPLANTTWTPNGSGNVVFTEQNLAPANLLTPSSADQGAAPLIILPKINGSINVPFHCWPGTVNPPPAANQPLIPGSSNAIDTVAVGNGTTTTTAGGSTTTTTPGSTTTTAVGATTTTAAGDTTTSASGSSGPTSTASGSGSTGSGATSNTGSHTYAATCTNNVQPGSPSQLTFALKGTAPAQVAAGNGVTLTDQSWNVAVPGTLLTTAINLGLLSAGQTVASTVNAAIFASNTSQGTIISAPIPVAFGPVKVDASGQAADAAVTFAVPNQTWTAVGGTVGFSMAKTVMLITIGALKVTFTCDPGTNLAAFVSTAVTGRTAAASVLGAQLAFTGPRSVIALTILALILLDLGYLGWSASVPGRRRRSNR